MSCSVMVSEFVLILEYVYVLLVCVVGVMDVVFFV